MISAISSYSGGLDPASYNVPSAGNEKDVARLKSEISSTKAEIGDCDCEDTKKKLEAELRNLQAELATAQASQNTPSANYNATTANEGDNDRERVARLFSGESDRIGTLNFDETTPFGERTAYF